MKKLQVTLVLLSVILAACGGSKGDPENGKILFEQKTIGSKEAPGCGTCHALEVGEVIVGPSLFNVSSRVELTIKSSAYTGEATSADEFLRESILKPDVFVKEGFLPGIMYPKFGEELTEEQIDDLVAYLKTL
ncbi:MAG: cytochrome c [Chloroflexi bacterium]|nr:cytochrome c [Chloroflexota bacterium]